MLMMMAKTDLNVVVTSLNIPQKLRSRVVSDLAKQFMKAKPVVERELNEQKKEERKMPTTREFS
ncbi:CLUMA_CG021655, isoform A [Clunio marinus]|uniref:CLUMA_CG021655, isoform A n=1 Tax=Clunio marinus TaxID=568069 RepID=A0A1J1J9G1_9DIPT|nr:CLUMA_CG021655, isoform A [Clunio marinus]